MTWRYLDKIVEATPGVSLYGIKCFSRSEPFFDEHFKGYPIVPGVLQIEMMAQAGGKAIRLLDDALMPILGSVKKAKFIAPIEPGDQCHIYAQIEKLAKTYALAHGVVKVAGKVISESTLLYAMIDRSKLDQSFEDPVLSDFKRRKELSP